MLIISSFIEWFKFKDSLFLYFRIMFVVIVSSLWWRDVSRESREGDHRRVTQDGLKIGIALFIFREVIFFVAWFWGFFHRRVVPTFELGLIWPPYNITPLNPFEVPLFNTVILLRSGITVTWAHHNLLVNKRGAAPIRITILLGAGFTSLQLFEYQNSLFSMRDRRYGSTFFVSTGFHGLHVLIGTLFLRVVMFYINRDHLTIRRHLRGELAIWYWHFVDVVWLFLFSFIYWWAF